MSKPTITFSSDSNCGIYKCKPGDHSWYDHDEPCDDFRRNAWDGPGVHICYNCGFRRDQHEGYNGVSLAGLPGRLKK